MEFKRHPNDGGGELPSQPGRYVFPQDYSLNSIAGSTRVAPTTEFRAASGVRPANNAITPPTTTNSIGGLATAQSAPQLSKTRHQCVLLAPSHAQPPQAEPEHAIPTWWRPRPFHRREKLFKSQVIICHIVTTLHNHREKMTRSRRPKESTTRSNSRFM